MMEDETYFQKTTSQIITRERTKRRMAALGFEFPDSSVNFLSHGIRSTMGKCCFKRCDRDRSMSDIGISQRSGVSSDHYRDRRGDGDTL